MDIAGIGRFIAEQRQAKGMTQKELAGRLRVSDKAVSRWETGKGLPDPSSWLELCEALDIGVNDLLAGRRVEQVPHVREVDEAVADATLYFATRNRAMAEGILLGLALVVLLATAVVHAFPPPVSPLVDYMYAPYRILPAVLPFFGWAGAFLIFLGIVLPNGSRCVLIAVGAALGFAAQLAGMGTNLELLDALLRGQGDRFLHGSADVLEIFVLPFLTLATYALLLVGGIAGFRKGLAACTAACTAGLAAGWVSFLVSLKGYLLYHLILRPVDSAYQTAVLLGTGSGMVLFAVGLTVFLIRRFREPRKAVPARPRA